MQKILIAVLAVATLALAVVCAVQYKQSQSGQQQLSASREQLRQEAEKRQADASRIKELERVEARLEKQVKDFTKVTTSLRASEAAQSSNLTIMAAQVARKGTNDSEEGTGNGVFGKGMGEMIGKLMKDPAMRDMMQEQQKATIKMMYGGLFKELNVTPEEKEKLLDLLTKSQMSNLAAAQGLMGGDKSKENMDQLQKQIADAKTESDAEIKAMLGDDRFGQYTNYQKNIGERMQLDQFSSRLQSANLPLQDQQMASLLQAMQQERDAVPPVIPSDASQSGKNLQALMTPDNLDKQLKWMEDYNRRVLDRAGQILSPEQLKEYREFQEQQASMQKLGLKMAREMFGGGTRTAQ